MYTIHIIAHYKIFQCPGTFIFIPLILRDVTSMKQLNKTTKMFAFNILGFPIKQTFYFVAHL